MLTAVLALVGFALLFGMVVIAARQRRFEPPGGLPRQRGRTRSSAWYDRGGGGGWMDPGDFGGGGGDGGGAGGDFGGGGDGGGAA